MTEKKTGLLDEQTKLLRDQNAKLDLHSEAGRH